MQKGVSLQPLDHQPPTPDAEPAPFVHSKSGNMKVLIGGYVRTDAIYDFDACGDSEAFVTSLISVKDPATGKRYVGSPQASEFIHTGDQSNIHARQSRLYIEGVGESDSLGSIKLRLEGDFFGSNTSFRLRHTYGEVGNWLIGQSWSNFGDLASLPNTLDFEGPNSQLPGRG